MYRLHLAGFDQPLVLAEGQGPEDVLYRLSACCAEHRAMSLRVMRGRTTVECYVNPAAVAYWFIDEAPDRPTAVAFR